MRFYNQDISTPLSLAHNTNHWNTSTIGQLVGQTSGAVYIKELPQAIIGKVQYAWRVVDAYWNTEDSEMTTFRAYGRAGEPLPFTTFGVNWSDAPHISGGFKFPPLSQQQYIPIDNKFMTAESGGYTVQVLDLDNPSEGLAFGLFKQNKKHQALVVSFRLFEIGLGYPNDLGLMVR